MEEKTKTSCLNCSAPKGSEDLIFCAYCGQKHGTGKVSLTELLGELMNNIFNFDSKTIRTTAALFIPGKLTEEYFRGKHKSYSHPIRMFFVSAIFFFAAVTLNIGEYVGSQNTFTQRVDRFLEKAKNMALLDSLKEEVTSEFPDSLVHRAIDSMIAGVDSSYALEFDGLNVQLSGVELQNDSIFVDEKYIRPEEFRNLSPGELVEKHWADSSFVKKVGIRQSIKVVKDNGSMLAFMVNKVPLMLLVMMPFLALFLKLIYYRRNRFYVEHLFFSFHLHAFIFFLGTFLILGESILPDGLTLMIGLSIFVYLFVALKKVYGESFIKTFFKFLVLLVFYSVLAVLFLILFSVISFLLF